MVNMIVPDRRFARPTPEARFGARSRECGCATQPKVDQHAGRTELYDLLRRHNVTQFAYVPDAGHRILIDRSLADPAVHSVALTTEEEGVALLAGADLGGARGVLLMQTQRRRQLHQHAVPDQGRRLSRS